MSIFIRNVAIGIVLATILFEVTSGQDCFNKPKWEKIKKYASTEWKKMCDSGAKPGCKPSHLKFASNLLRSLTSKGFLGQDTTDIPDRDTVIKAAEQCNNDLSAKGELDYCSSDCTNKFKDCLVPKVLFSAPGLKIWFDTNCPKINTNVVEQDQKTIKKVGKYFQDFNKIK